MLTAAVISSNAGNSDGRIGNEIRAAFRKKNHLGYHGRRTSFMIIRLRLLVVSFVTICSSVFSAHSQTPKEMAERFFDQLNTGNTKQAFDELASGSALKYSDLQGLADKVKDIFSNNGNPITFERVSETEMGPSLDRLFYLQKYDRYFLTWNLVFYKGRSQWLLARVQFDEGSGLLENSGK